MDDWKRSGQIPAFGNWDYGNDLPITQYFECARQAGLIRYSSSSGESDLYAVDNYRRNQRKTTTKGGVRGEKRSCHVKEQRKQQGKAFDVTEQEQPRKQISQQQSYINTNKYNPKLVKINPKHVDEDLYKIPPELLRSTKRAVAHDSLIVGYSPEHLTLMDKLFELFDQWMSKHTSFRYISVFHATSTCHINNFELAKLSQTSSCQTTSEKLDDSHDETKELTEKTPKDSRFHSSLSVADDILTDCSRHYVSLEEKLHRFEEDARTVFLPGATVCFMKFGEHRI